MNVVIDGKQIEFSAEDMNLVELAERNGVRIPAPCFHAQRKTGCCNGCVVEVDGEQQYACVTTPRDGMQIVVNRDDLNALREDRIRAYSAVKDDPTKWIKCDCDDATCCSSNGCC